MKILVTGSDGYIGKHLVNKLAKLYDVYQADLKNPVRSIDIRDPIDSDIHFDAIIHLASLVNVSRSTLFPAEYFDTNVNGTLNLLKNVSYDHFIFASSGNAVTPVNPYGLSKRMAEYVIEDYCCKHDKNYSIFRFFNVTGVDGFPPRADGLLASLLKAEKDGVFYIYGSDYNTPDGTAIRDYTHVNEICAALIDAISEPANGIEGLGHSVGTSVKEMVDIYRRVNNCNFEVEILPRRQGDLEKSVLDNVSSYMKTLYTIEDLLKKKD